MKDSVKPLIDFIFTGVEPKVDLQKVPDVPDEELEAYFESATIKCLE